MIVTLCQCQTRVPVPESPTGSSFFVSTTKVDQATARTECQNMGGVLASITDEDDTIRYEMLV